MKINSSHSFSKRLTVFGSAIGLLALFGAPCIAGGTEAKGASNAVYEEVTSFSTLGGIQSFSALDRETLIIWSNRSTPYLIGLAGPSFELKFAHVIGIRSRPGRVYSGFDSVYVDGMRYPIRRIYKLSREDARALEADAKAARRG